MEQQWKEENEEKKKYLYSYQNTTKKLKRLKAELEEVEGMINGLKAVSSDGMPHGNVHTDLSDLFVRLEEMQRNVKAEQKEQIGAYVGIKNSIDKLTNENEKDVMFYRYIKNLNWWDIAEQMNYTERWVLKLHGKALAHLSIHKKSS